MSSHAVIEDRMVLPRAGDATGIHAPLSCPACEYSWCGLPNEYRCPECGLAYDSDTQLWTARKWRRRGAATWVSLALVAILAEVLDTMGTITTIRGQAVEVILGGWLVLAVADTIRY